MTTTPTQTILNNVLDWIWHRTSRQWLWAGIITAVISLAGYLVHLEHQFEAELVDRGAQEVRDSLSAVAAVRLHKEWVAADSTAKATANDFHRSSDSLTQVAAGYKTKANGLSKQLASLSDITVKDSLPGIAVVTIRDTAYQVPLPVAVWIDTASQALQAADSIIGFLSSSLTAGLNHLRTEADSAIDSRQREVVIADSLLAASRAETKQAKDALKAEERKSAFQRAYVWVERVLLACGAYSLGAHHPCWR